MRVPQPDSHSSHKISSRGFSAILLLSLAAMGVVYGDIGTSPLYAINEIFFGRAREQIAASDIVGLISIVIWALTIIVTFKYVMFVLMADNDGEGGVFALYAMLRSFKTRSAVVISTLLIIAAGLLFGDGIITPAISVISAVEGMKIATAAFSPYVVLITVLILTGLFAIQSKGTSKVGNLFGPIIIIWFFSISFLGLAQILSMPQILFAFNPANAVMFFMHHDIKTIFTVLGSVMLVVTGGEAMYADMGHFGRTPIRLSWFSAAYPALLLNYLGQGAYLLSGKPVVEHNIFFSMVPHEALFPMVFLATFATIIASQALISGAFSLASQAISLGLLPHIRTIHTHHEHEGQIYIPFINWSLYIGCVLLVVNFQSSARLAAAYGLAVSGVMLVTSLGMILVAQYYWKWKLTSALALFLPLAAIDTIFLSANSLKIIDGGYIPLAIGLAILLVMKTWEWGRSHVVKTFKNYAGMAVKDLIVTKEQSDICIPRSIIMMTPEEITSVDDKIPTLKQLFWERYGVLPQHLLFLTVVMQKVPHINDNRFTVRTFYNDDKKGSIAAVTVNFGFMEETNVENVLQTLTKHHEINLSEDQKTWLVHIMQERIMARDLHTVFAKIRFTLFKFLKRNSDTADYYFELGKEHPLTVEIIPVYLK